MTSGRQSVGQRVSSRVNLINSNTPVTITDAEYVYFYLGMTEGNSGGEYGYLLTIDDCADTLDVVVHEAVDMDGPWSPVEESLAVPAVPELNWSRGDVMWGSVVRLGIKKSTAGSTTARVKGVAK
jgi:hypothetical protein